MERYKKEKYEGLKQGYDHGKLNISFATKVLNVVFEQLAKYGCG